jgi:peptide/nickel transport system permease protein
MFKYFSKKLLIYILTFFVAASINWAIPRFMPGNPIQTLLAEFDGLEGAQEVLRGHLVQSFNMDQPLWQQFLSFWRSLFRGDLGVSIRMYPRTVWDIVTSSFIYDIIIFFPAIVLSWIVGNKLGAYSAFNKKADEFLMPFIYFLRSAPYFWFAVVIVFVFGFTLGWFPTSQAHSSGLTPGWNLPFVLDFLHHWFLPFMSLFMVNLGSWAIGMRSMVIYEKKASYSEYMRSLGAGNKLIRKYAFRNGVLPQVSGLAIRIGAALNGVILVERIFNYPGLGYRMF